MKKIFLLFFVLTVGIYADDVIRVTFVKGDVKLTDGGKTFKPKMGMVISEDATFEVPPNGDFQFSKDEKVFDVETSGKFTVKKILDGESVAKVVTIPTVTGGKAKDREKEEERKRRKRLNSNK